jgi:transglutaminase-like putative cysteine protease
VSEWKVRLPLYAAGLATGGAFSVLFVGGALPYLLGAALVALLVGSAGAYRFALLFPAIALYGLLAPYGRPPLSLRGWRRLLERVGQDVYEAVGIMYVNPIPFDAHPGLFVILVPILMIVVAFATSATLYESSPVVSVAVLGLTIGVLSTISFEAGIGPFFALFLVSGITLLLLAGDGTRRGEGLKPAAVLAGALVLLLVLALPNAPVAREAIRPAAMDWTKIGTSDASRLAVEVDVGDYLTTGRDVELMRIQSSEPLLWRGGTLDYFDGSRWSSTVEPVGDYGEEISANVPTYQVQQRVEMLEAETNLIFGGYRISGVTVPRAQERSDGSWASVRPFTEGSYYRVLSQVPQPTTAQLQAAGAFYPANVQEKFLQLPEDRPEVLRATAQDILAGYEPQTPYAAARAIERYLIHDGGFIYDLSVDYDGTESAIEEFLGGDKRGFCTQFATSMALLAREMGIPSRVVYGATAGDEVKPEEHVVTGYDMHTWVEIYFPGVGWYPFDPTPGFSIPATMEANAPRPPLPIPEYNASPQNPAPRQEEASEPAPETQKSPADEGAASPAEKAPAPIPYSYVLPLVLLLALLIAGVPLLKRLLAARGRPKDLYWDLVGRLRDVLPPGVAGAVVADSPALTPTERLSLLAGAVGVEAGPFREFARAYSESLYAPDPGTDAARAYRKALREYRKLPPWKRALGAVNLGSLLSRARMVLVGYRARIGKTLRGRKG